MIQIESKYTVLSSPIDISSVKLFTTNRSSLKLVELARRSQLGLMTQLGKASDRYPEGASSNPAWADNFSDASPL